MPRYKLAVAYDGTDFHGWQKQHAAGATAEDPLRPTWEDDRLERGMIIEAGADADSGAGLATSSHARAALRTVQGVLEEAVRAVVREPVDVVGASRTDSGVHALGQVAAFTTMREFPVEKLPRAISSRLPSDVQVRRAEVVADDFDPIRGAVAKGYRYRLMHSCARGPRPLFNRRFVAHSAYRLDPELMNEAARRLMGEHDFASFTRIDHGRETTVRTVHACKATAVGRRMVDIEVVGNGFLYNMVRIIAGTLLEAGRGKLAPESIPDILAAKDRGRAGPTMPPEGLCLMWIKY